MVDGFPRLSMNTTKTINPMLQITRTSAQENQKQLEADVIYIRKQLRHTLVWHKRRFGMRLGDTKDATAVDWHTAIIQRTNKSVEKKFL